MILKHILLAMKVLQTNLYDVIKFLVVCMAADLQLQFVFMTVCWVKILSALSPRLHLHLSRMWCLISSQCNSILTCQCTCSEHTKTVNIVDLVCDHKENKYESHKNIQFPKTSVLLLLLLSQWDNHRE